MRVLAIISGVLMLAGCAASSNVEPITISQKEPEFFIKFERGSAIVNNKFILREKFNQRNELIKSRPMVLMQSYADTIDAYQLALFRLENLKDALDVDAEFRLFVKRAERSELADFVAITIGDSSETIDERIYSQNFYSEIQGADGVYKEDSKRLLLARPISKDIIPEGETIIEQINFILSDLGWSLVDKGCEVPHEIKRIQKLKVVTLSNDATQSEVMSLLNGLVNEVTPYCEFQFSESKKTVDLKNI